MRICLAIDIGASSGRHIIGYCKNGEIQTEEMYRFQNGMKKLDGHLVWDTEELFNEIVCGIKKCFEKYPDIYSLSIDTWGVDYVLMKGDEPVYPVYAYRDSRTEDPIEKVHSIISESELYQKTGITFQPFNTIYQLYADKEANRFDGVTDFLMLPEYLMYRLTGVKKKEYTNASTTGLVNAYTKQFDIDIINRLGLPEHIFKPLDMPETVLGSLLPEIAKEVGGNTTVVFCATHDTASAVEGIPMETDSPYISSGTWSLLGIKSDKPYTSEESRLSGYSNEGGVGYIRYLTNIMGLWIVQSLRKELCPDVDFAKIEKDAQKSDFAETFDVNDKRFFAPSSMKEAIDSCFADSDRRPALLCDYFSSVFHSLAKGYATAIGLLEESVGKKYDSLYIVGGGAKNQFLNRLTEHYCKKKVVALPIEATALGNLKTQLNRTK